jgi:hypothetical protein
MTIAPHLNTEELQARFRQAKTPIVAHHYQILWLLACGKTTAEVMAVTAYIKSERSLVIRPESEPTNENWLALELALVARSTFYILKTELLRVHQD